MRVLLLITKGELGGAQTHVLELCRALAGRVDFLVLIGGEASSPLGDELTRCGVRVQHVASIGNSMSPLPVLRSVWRVLQIARSWAPDAIHVHSAAAAVVGRLAGSLAGVAVVYTVHGFGFKPAVPWPRRTVAYAVECLLAPLTHAMICVSDHERGLSHRLPIAAQRVKVVSNGLSDRPMRAAPGTTPPTLVMVARMAAPKRHDLLLEALAILRGRGVEQCSTVLVGSGPQHNDLQARVHELGLTQVQLPGDIDDVPEVLARCQVFVLLSDHEGQPISVIEAMRAGLPIVATDLPGIRTQATHGHEALLTPNRPNDVADAIQRLLGDPQQRVRMGLAARERYERQFAVQTMADRTAEIYEAIPGARSPETWDRTQA